MKHEIFRFAGLYAGFLCLALAGCGTFGRVVEVHKTDTIKIEAGLVRDTTWIFEKNRDTIRTEFATVYRYGDTLRLHYIERPCTTYVSKTETRTPQPKAEKGPEGPFSALTFWEKALLLLAVAIIFVILLKR